MWCLWKSESENHLSLEIVSVDIWLLLPWESPSVLMKALWQQGWLEQLEMCACWQLSPFFSKWKYCQQKWLANLATRQLMKCHLLMETLYSSTALRAKSRGQFEVELSCQTQTWSMSDLWWWSGALQVNGREPMIKSWKVQMCKVAQ